MALCACNGHRDDSNKGILRYPLTTKPTTLDPGLVQDGDSITIISQVYEGLVQWNEKNEVQPDLAEKWEISPDGKTYTFHLKNAQFTDGRPLTAQDFKSAWERNCSPSLASPTAGRFLIDIQGAKDMLAGRADHISGLQAPDPQTLKVTLDQPKPYFLEKLTVPVADVFDIQALANPGKEITKPAEMIGTGPFKLENLDTDQIITLVPNDSYRDGKPALTRIERPYVPDSATRLSMYKDGYVNYLRLERQDVKGILADPVLKNQLHFISRPALWYFGINCALTPGFEKPQVRRAIALAIDRDYIAKTVLDGVNPEATAIIPPGVFGHRDFVAGIPYDPVRAKAELAQAGYPNGKGLPEITIWYRNNRPDMKLLALAVGQDLTKNLGLKVSFKATDWAKLLASDNKRTTPFVALRWSADFLDAQDFLSGLLTSEAAGNTLKYSNPEFDRLCAQADTSMDPKLRLTLYAKAEDIAIQDAPLIPICNEQDAELISPKVHGIGFTLIGHMPHAKVTVE